jgi:hypothetical protein
VRVQLCKTAFYFYFFSSQEGRGNSRDEASACALGGPLSPIAEGRRRWSFTFVEEEALSRGIVHVERVVLVRLSQQWRVVVGEEFEEKGEGVTLVNRCEMLMLCR